VKPALHASAMDTSALDQQVWSLAMSPEETVMLWVMSARVTLADLTAKNASIITTAHVAWMALSIFRMHASHAVTAAAVKVSAKTGVMILKVPAIPKVASAIATLPPLLKETTAKPAMLDTTLPSPWDLTSFLALLLACHATAMVTKEPQTFATGKVVNAMKTTMETSTPATTTPKIATAKLAMLVISAPVPIPTLRESMTLALK
jgi:hypothetical protein